MILVVQKKEEELKREIGGLKMEVVREQLIDELEDQGLWIDGGLLR